VQTNVDQRAYDKDTRRTAATRKIEAIGQDITLEQLYEDVLTVYPNFNLYTIETIMMDAKGFAIMNTSRWY
jgi:hypothetical protein